MNRFIQQAAPIVCRALLGAAGLSIGLSSLSLAGCIIVATDHYDSDDERDDSRRSSVLGVDVASVATSTATQANVDASRTCIITHVSDNSAAERAGLQKYDIITHLDGKDWATPSALREAVRSKHDGEALSIGYVRAGKACETTATIGSR